MTGTPIANATMKSASNTGGTLTTKTSIPSSQATMAAGMITCAFLFGTFCTPGLRERILGACHVLGGASLLCLVRAQGAGRSNANVGGLGAAPGEVSVLVLS